MSKHLLCIAAMIIIMGRFALSAPTWTDWGDWSSCNCDGKQVRTRECYHELNLRPAYHCQGLNTETIFCKKNDTACYPDIWNAWSDWTSCINLCSENIRIRVRYCTNGEHTQLTNSCQGNSVDISPCADINCTSEDHWTDWSTWTSCTVTCGGGVTYRSRNCRTYEQIIANDCHGDSVESESCNNNVCEDNAMRLSTFSSVVMSTTTPASATIAPGIDLSVHSTTTPSSLTTSTSHHGSQHAILDFSTLSTIVSKTTIPASVTIVPRRESSEHSTTTAASYTTSTSQPSSQPHATAANTTPVTTNASQSKSISCFECTDDPSGCEYNYQPVTCSSPNNYCINDLTNNGDASRVIIRRCGNYDECVNDWWQTYSDNELCKNFNQDTPYNVAFNCKFCCVKDACNEKINPPKETNFVKN